MMKMLQALMMAGVVTVLAACASPQDKAAKAQQGAYKAQEDVAKKRIQLTNQYQKCVKEAGGDKQKAEACESYLKAAEALK